MNSDIDIDYEPLPGYRLIERIGAGGYGEVWRAKAPGGLDKAIKFVFGKHDGRRAANELRALERVREVRHPFLLSLERIEIVDGRLVVVTELANGSVKDRFDACRQLGMPGIPRDELLGYLRDAADALDFMSDQHSLQHLDIKPENLLLLAGHVKVGDFGLVKDVQQMEASLVGGMTPLYAAPELFQGTPTRYSDQYSLAIVCQDMLTGMLPFAGRTAAELTLQHLSDEPDLTSLSADDRYVVSRALAKNPRHRYASCHEFVEALAKSAAGGSEPWQKPSADGSSASGTRPATETDSFAEQQCIEEPSSHEPPRFTLPPTGYHLTNLPPVDIDPRQFQPTPTLLLGVGGIAGRVLSHLRRKMVEQYGTMVIPAMPLLWIDTDPADLAAANDRATGRLLLEETFALPLRRPSHYRDRSQQLLHWLSRRWLYNIPRSLCTEGLRPLGRLALVDHARQTGQRLRRAILEATDAAAIQTSSQALGRPFRTGDFRVYILASISGGTGSGMSIDLGYLTRAVLKSVELSRAQVIGLLMHATGRDANHAELARVNAFSWLSEFHHFQQPTNAYENDGSCCMPTQEPQVPPFDSTYLAHLGDGLDQRELDYAAESVAEYLRCGSQTPAQAFFDVCRKEDNCPSANEQGPHVASPRSFGVYRKPAVGADLCDDLAAAVSRRVVMGWRRPRDECIDVTVSGTGAAAAGDLPRSPGEAATPLGGAQLAERLCLDPDAATSLAMSLVETQLGTDPPSFLAANADVGSGGPAARIAAIDQLFNGDDAQPGGDTQATLLGRPVSAIVGTLAERLRAELRRWIVDHVDDPSQRLPGARRAAAWLRDYLVAAEERIEQLRHNTVAQTLVARNTVLGPASKAVNGPDDADPVLCYFQLRLRQLAQLGAWHMTDLILADLRAVTGDLAAFENRLGQFQAALSGSTSDHLADDLLTESAVQDTQPDAASSVPSERLNKLVVDVDRRVQQEYLHEHNGLYATVMRGGRDRAQLCATLHQYAREAVDHAWASAQTFGPSDEESDPQGALAAGLSLATPRWLDHGRTRRVLMVIPRDAAGKVDREDASRLIGAEASTAVGPDNNLMLCVEAGGLSLSHVAADIIDYRQDRRSLAERVHVRNDIAWTPLIPSDGRPPATAQLAPPPVGSAELSPIEQTELI